jgi:hypothetical protein
MRQDVRPVTLFHVCPLQLGKLLPGVVDLFLALAVDLQRDRLVELMRTGRVCFERAPRAASGAILLYSFAANWRL